MNSQDYNNYIKAQEGRSPDGIIGEPSPWVDKVIKNFPQYLKGPLLDIGSGSGSSMKAFEDMGLWTIGLDISMPSVLSAIHQGKHVIFGDVALGLPFPDSSFETITMFHTLEHVLDIPSTLRHVHRALRGHFICIAPFEREVSKPHGHYAAIRNAEQFRSYFKDFEIVEDSPDYYGHLIIAKKVI